MKTKGLAILACTAITILRAQAQGYIVPNGVTYAGYVPGAGSVFHVVQTPANSDFTGFFLDPQTLNTFKFSPFTDGGVRVFLVSPNAPISLQAILTPSYTELLYPNSYVFGVSSTFYVGLYTGYSPQNGIYTDPLFGWAKLVNNQGVIQLLDSALAYKADGIFAGTQNIIQPVPEPGVLTMSGLGLLGLGWWMRRRLLC